jgi:hypothetical protein
MPVTSPSLTQRLFLHYTSGGLPHQICLRPATPQPPSVLLAMANDATNDLVNYMLDIDSVNSAEFCGVGSNVRFPLGFTAATGNVSLAGNQYADDPESVMWSLTGKGLAAGVKWSHRFFSAYNFGGVAWPLKNRWNIATAPTAVVNYWTAISDWWSTLGVGGVQLVTAGSQPPIIHTWVNISHNGFWTRKQRL